MSISAMTVEDCKKSFKRLGDYRYHQHSGEAYRNVLWIWRKIWRRSARAKSVIILRRYSRRPLIRSSCK